MNTLTNLIIAVALVGTVAAVSAGLVSNPFGMTGRTAERERTAQMQARAEADRDIARINADMAREVERIRADIEMLRSRREFQGVQTRWLPAYALLLLALVEISIVGWLLVARRFGWFGGTR